jgi:hypothetical protein
LAPAINSRSRFGGGESIFNLTCVDLSEIFGVAEEFFVVLMVGKAISNARPETVRFVAEKCCVTSLVLMPFKQSAV